MQDLMHWVLSEKTYLERFVRRIPINPESCGRLSERGLLAKIEEIS